MRSGLVVVSVTAGGRFINIWPSELDFLTRSISNNWVGGGQGEGGDQSDTYWVGAENTPNVLEGGNCGLNKLVERYRGPPGSWHRPGSSGKGSCCLTATGKLKYLFLELVVDLSVSWPEYESFVGAGAVENEDILGK